MVTVLGWLAAVAIVVGLAMGFGMAPREVLTLALHAARSNPGPHLGPFVLPPIPDV